MAQLLLFLTASFVIVLILQYGNPVFVFVRLCQIAGLYTLLAYSRIRELYFWFKLALHFKKIPNHWQLLVGVSPCMFPEYEAIRHLRDPEYPNLRFEPVHKSSNLECYYSQALKLYVTLHIHNVAIDPMWAVTMKITTSWLKPTFHSNNTGTAK